MKFAGSDCTRFIVCLEFTKDNIVHGFHGQPGNACHLATGATVVKVQQYLSQVKKYETNFAQSSIPGGETNKQVKTVVITRIRFADYLRIDQPYNSGSSTGSRRILHKMSTITETKPTNLKELIDFGWESKPVKQEIRDNFLRMLASGEDLYPGIIGYENTVIPEINIALLSGHDMLYLGEKGQAKSRLMRGLVQFLDPAIPYLDLPEAPFHEDPLHPLSKSAREFVASHEPTEIPIKWWPREDRYAERLAPGTKFADIIGEIDPAKLAGGQSMSTEGALHFGLIPRMHRGIFAINELPELDELVQVGLFNILEERDVQIRGYPVRFDIDVMILFSANPSTFNRSGKVIPQLKDRIGSTIQTHYPVDRDQGVQIMEQESEIDLEGDYPVRIPYFMKEICEQISVQARKSKYVDQQSGSVLVSVSPTIER